MASKNPAIVVAFMPIKDTIEGWCRKQDSNL
jgi:hypothetical protein